MLRDGRGEADRGLTAAPSLRGWLDGNARQPGGQDVLVAPRAVVRVYVIEDEAMDAAVAARSSCARRRRSIGARRGQNNLATTYHRLGRSEEASRILRDVYSGYLKLHGEEYCSTLRAASNYAGSLMDLQRFGEAKSLTRKMMPVARRFLGDNDRLTLKMRDLYARALYKADDATLGDLREAVTTLEETARIARRVLGSAHPLTGGIERDLQKCRATLGAREPPPGSSKGSN